MFIVTITILIKNKIIHGSGLFAPVVKRVINHTGRNGLIPLPSPKNHTDLSSLVSK